MQPSILAVLGHLGPSNMVSGTRDNPPPETTLSSENGFPTSGVKVDPASDYS